MVKLAIDHTTPAYHNSAYAALSSTEWFVGNDNGTLLDGASLSGTLKYFGYGLAWAVAAGGSRAALAMSAEGSVLTTALTNQDTGISSTAPALQVSTVQDQEVQ